MIIHTMEQRSEEWYQVKLGKFSASMIAKLLMSKTTQGYNDAIDQVVYERVTGNRISSFASSDMQYGIDNEPLAKRDYMLKNFTYVRQVGFIENNEWSGVSPDGLIGSEGMIEIKCPKYNTQLRLLRDCEVQKDYEMQMQFQMFVSGRQWVDFYSWRHDLEPFQKRYFRNEGIITILKNELEIAITKAIVRIKQYNQSKSTNHNIKNVAG